MNPDDYELKNGKVMHKQTKKVIYKQSCLAGMLKSVFIDATKLSVSLVNPLDWKSDESNCRELVRDDQVESKEMGYVQGKQAVIKTIDGVYYKATYEVVQYEFPREQDEVNIMASYTHPAIAATVYEQNKEFM